MDPSSTSIPARLDRLGWSRFHVLLIAALGIAWLLDGLEVTIVGAMSGILESPYTLHLTPSDIGAVASFYISGAVTGALVFGGLADRFGRRRIFFITMICYLSGVLLSACSWNFGSFALFRMLTGFGIGGEYAAVNSAIDELIPARLRGRTNLAVNGTYWLGAALGGMLTIPLLNPAILPIALGWRLGFVLGSILGIAVLALRSHVPESPRWLIAQGRMEEAEHIMASIEQHAGGGTSEGLRTIPVRSAPNSGLRAVVRTLFSRYPSRTFLVLVLMAAQAFLYNALFFTYTLVLVRFYAVPPGQGGYFLVTLAIANFLGPLLLGRFFDTIGRRIMLTVTYALTGILLAATAILFLFGMLSAMTQTLTWAAIFFVASAAASSAYLTVSEIFPVEMRARAIAILYAFGTAIGGIAAPWIFGHLIGTGSRAAISGGYAGACVLMLIAAAVAARFAVDAENRPLEDITPPLSS